MDRKKFLASLSLLPLSSLAMKLNELNKLSETFGASDKMPVLFVGHGNPMNAITDNTYSKTWAEIGKKIPAPKAILSISAHWLTRGTSVTMSAKPQTIHDFGGFPDELFKVNYPAPGAVDYARMAIAEVKSTKVHEDLEWGLDHGTWSVLRQMYPTAAIPVFQMSIDYNQAPSYHFELAKQLGNLRKKGVLIIGSGNVVHNLGQLNWKNDGSVFDWAQEFDQFVKKNIENNTPDALLNYDKLGKLALMAHPSNDHYLPLIYTLGLRDKSDDLSFFNESFDLGSISMRSVILK